MMLLQLFWSFFQVGLFSFGGGLAALPLIKSQIVDHHGWLTLTEFTDLITIAEMTPGPIAVNSATFVGITIAGLPGAIIATLGCIMPACIIVSFFAHIYFKYNSLSSIQGVLSGLRPAVVALIAAAGLSILLIALWGEDVDKFNIVNIDFQAAVIFVIGLIILRKLKASPIVVILGSGIAGGISYLFFNSFN